MEKWKINILLIDGDATYKTILAKMLKKTDGLSFSISSAGGLSSGICYLENSHFDIVLLDLYLPDSKGLEVFTEVHAHFPETPIILLTHLLDEKIAVSAVQAGAQDYLLKEGLRKSMLVRSIRNAISRHKHHAPRRGLSILDELTGLYNRRGLKVLGEQSLKISVRKNKNLFLLFIDVDGLKKVNDTFGHAVGDMLLRDTAAILQKTFRDTDIKARISGDEFAIIALEFSGKTSRILVSRLMKNIKAYNLQKKQSFKLSVSCGIARNDPADPSTIDELIKTADTEMYKNKKVKKSQKLLFDM